MPTDLKKKPRRQEAPAQQASQPTPRLPTPEESTAFLEGVHLQWIRLAHCELNARSRHAGVPLEPRIEEESVTYRVLDGRFLVFHGMKFSGVPTEGGGDGITIRATFELEYTSKTPMTDAVFAVFRKQNLPVNIW